MVARIHQATLSLLANEGLEYLSTKRIAKQAEISPGSLYQYYPNKQAIVYAIYKDWLEHYATIIEEYFERRKQYACSRDWIEAALNAAYCHVLDLSDTEKRVDIELGKAMKLYPELHELDKKQGEKLSRYMAEVARHFGSTWPVDKLNRLCSYLYQLMISFEDIYSRTEENLEESLAWHISAVSSIFDLSLSE